MQAPDTGNIAHVETQFHLPAAWPRSKATATIRAQRRRMCYEVQPRGVDIKASKGTELSRLYKGSELRGLRSNLHARPVSLEKSERGYPWEHAPPGFAGKGN